MKQMFKSIISILTFAIAILIFATSSTCNKPISEFQDLSDSEIESLNTLTESKLEVVGLSKGATWKAWNMFFKACIQSSNLRKAQFAGYSNTIKIGDIRTKDGLSSYSLEDIVSPQEYANLVKVGNEAQGCTMDRRLDKSILADIAASFLNGANASLSFAKATLDTVFLQTGDFQVEEIQNIDAFRKLINTDPKFKDYKSSLFQKDRLLIVQLVRASNIKLDIRLNSEMTAGVSAAFEAGIEEHIKVQEGTLTAKFTKKDSKNIICEVNNPFYLFMYAKRVKKD